jgi:hypothetical protein
MGAMFAKVLLPEAVVTELRAKHAGDADQIENANYQDICFTASS